MIIPRPTNFDTMSRLEWIEYVLPLYIEQHNTTSHKVMERVLKGVIGRLARQRKGLIDKGV